MGLFGSRPEAKLKQALTGGRISVRMAAAGQTPLDVNTVCQNVANSLAAPAREMAAKGNEASARSLLVGAREASPDESGAIWNQVIDAVIDHVVPEAP